MTQRALILVSSLLAFLVLGGTACAQPEPTGGLPFDNPLRPSGEAEQKVLTALEEMRAGQQHYNVSVRDGRALRLLTEAVNAQRVVEIGTSTGESAVWFALALRRTGGHLYTHEIDEERAQIARENFRTAGVDSLITLIEGDAHETVHRYEEPIDILFLDADKSGYPDYLDTLLPLVRPGGLVIAHNMNRPEPDPRYVEAITQSPELESMFLFMDAAGLSVTMKKRQHRAAARVASAIQGPANHHGNIVGLGRRYVVDVGLGPPMCRSPLPLDGITQTDEVNVEWRVAPSERPDATYRVESRTPGDGDWTLRYVFGNTPRLLRYFEATNDHLQSAPESPFIPF